jgi:RpiB/LacA/LacB family sugar-phosphate isomerase
MERGYAVAEIGATDESAYDYPDAAAETARRIQSGAAPFGVLICGTGIGMSIAANRFSGVRAAVCCSVEAAKLAREHNHANILCLGARLINPDAAVSLLQAFLDGTESEEPRHLRRVAKLDTVMETQTAS